jgi:peptide/nickel transport system substrate-binding protein
MSDRLNALPALTRRGFGAAAAATLATAAASPALAQGAPLRELKVGVQSHVRGLDMQSQTSNAAAQFLDTFVDTLIEVETRTDEAKYTPMLATSWERLSPTVTEFRLRDGVRMHDGTIMDAHDVAFSLNRVFQPTDARFRGAQGRYFYNFERAEVTGPMTVRLVTRKPEPLLEALLSCRNAGITSKEHVEAVGADRAELQPVGSGPYRVTSFNPNNELVVERFADHWGPQAPLERIRFIRIAEMAPRVTALLNRDIDFAVSLPPDQADLIRGRRDVRLVETTWPMFFIYVLNMSHPRLEDVRVRRALNLAIDRKALADALWGGKALPARGHYFQGFGEQSYLADLDFLKFDPAEARRLLKEANYDGSEMMLNFQPTYYTYGDQAAQAVLDMWKDVGINARLQIIDGFGQDPSKLMTRDWSNPLYYPDLLGAFDTHWSDSSWVTRDKYFLPQKFPEWGRLYEIVRFSPDPEARRDAYRKLVVHAETEVVPWILLYQPHEAFAMRAGIEWAIPKNVRPYQLTFRAGQIRATA